MFALLWYVCVLMAHESAAETEFVMPCFLVPEWRREERNGPRRGDLTRDFHSTSAYISHHQCAQLLLVNASPSVVSRFLNDRAVSFEGERQELTSCWRRQQSKIH